MKTSFDTLHERAKQLAIEVEWHDRSDVEIIILKALMAVKREAETQTIEAVEVSLLHQEHH